MVPVSDSSAVPPPGGTTAGRLTLTGGRAAYPLRDFLTRNQVPFTYLDQPGPDLARALAPDLTGNLAAAGGPVCVLPDGTRLLDPTIEQVAESLGLLRPARHDAYDLLIVGAGPAGLAAAVYAACEGLRTAVIEQAAPGGQAGTSSRVENYLGFPEGISGAELAARARAERLGAELLSVRRVIGGSVVDGRFLTELSDGSMLTGRAMVCATGVDWRRLEAPGIDRLLHAGVYYGAAASEAPGVRARTSSSSAVATPPGRQRSTSPATTAASPCSSAAPTSPGRCRPI